MSKEVCLDRNNGSVRKPHIHVPRNGERNAVHGGWTGQHCVPVLVHAVEELGAVDRIFILDMVPGGEIGWREIRRVFRKVREWRKGHGGPDGAIVVKQSRRN